MRRAPWLALAALLTAAPPSRAALLKQWAVTLTRTAGGSDDWRAGFTETATGRTAMVIRLPAEHRLVAYDAAGVRASSVALAGSAGWNEDALAAAPDGSGGVVVARSESAATVDVVVTRHDAGGALLWARVVDAGADERPAAVAVDAGGTVWVAGWRENAAGTDSLLAALGPDGTLLWTRTADFGAGADDAFYAVVSDGRGGALAAGPANAGGFAATHVAGYAPDGTLAFSRTLSASGGAGEYPRAAALAGATLFVACDSVDDLWLLALDPAGGGLRAAGRVTAAAAVTAGGVAPDPGGGAYVSASVAAATADLLLARFDAGAQPVGGWPVTLDAGGDEGDRWPVAGARAAADGAGVTVNASADLTACGVLHQDALVVRYGAGGARVWTAREDSAADAVFAGAGEDAAGAALVAGFAGADALVAKYGRDGTLAWERDPRDPFGCTEGFGGFASGGVVGYVTLDAVSPGNGTNMVRVAGYDSGGNAVYAAAFDAIPDAFAGPVAADPAGGVLLAGSFMSSTSLEDDLYLAKFDAGGSLAWARTLTFATDDRPSAVAIDPAGCAVLEAWPGLLGAGDNRYAVLRFDAQGNLLWTRTLPGSSGTSVVAVPGGLAAAAGSFFGCGYEIGYTDRPVSSRGTVFRLDAATGATVWSRAGAGNPDAAYTGLAADPGGRTYLAGATGSVPADAWDLLTASYGADGAARAAAALDLGSADELGKAVALGSVYSAGSSGPAATLVRYEESLPLGAALAAAPNPAPVGIGVRIALTVSNDGSERVDGLAPRFTPPDGLRLLTGPSPAGPLSLAPGAAAVFTWTASVTGSRSMTLAAGADGRQALSGEIVSADATAELAVDASRRVFPEAIVVYPNPVTGGRARVALNLDADADEVEVALYSVRVRRVWHRTFAPVARSDYGVFLDLAGLAPGVYLMRVRAAITGADRDQVFPVVKVVVK